MNAVKFFPPSCATRQYTHRGEEALVQRISFHKPFTDGWAERKEQMGRGRSRLADPNSVQIGDCGIQWDSNTKSGQAIRYYLLKLSHAFFPENFPEARALRFLEEGGKIYGVIYSEFIPDTTDCVARREQLFQDIAKIFRDRKNYAEDWQQENAFKQRRIQYDEDEKNRCPGIVEFAEKTDKAGITLIHPAANYHVREGKPVLFEPYRFYLKSAMEHAESLTGVQKRKAEVDIGLICLSSLSYAISYIRGKGEFKNEWRGLGALVDNNDPAFLHAFLSFVRNRKEEFSSALTNVNDIGYGPLNYINAVNELLPDIMANNHSF